MSKTRLTTAEIGLLLLAALYVLSPVDFIPELIAGPLGLVDDTAAIAIVALSLAKARSRHSSGSPNDQLST